jgi:hypothetical protein
MPPKARINGEPDYLSVAAWRDLIADACDFYADHMAKLGEEKEIPQVMAPTVKFMRLSAKQTREYADTPE